METLSLKLDAELSEIVTTEARRRNVSKSAVVRDSLRQQLGGRARTRDLSCADLAGALVGSLNSGRDDLATNKALLQEAILNDARRARKQRHR